MEKRKVTVILLPGGEGGYAVFIPLFPSCTTGGDNVQEALKNAKECLELALEKPTEDDLEFLGYLDVDHVVVSRIEVEVPAQVSASKVRALKYTWFKPQNLIYSESGHLVESAMAWGAAENPIAGEALRRRISQLRIPEQLPENDSGGQSHRGLPS